MSSATSLNGNAGSSGDSVLDIVAKEDTPDGGTTSS